MDKYLRLYAEPETAALDRLPGQNPWQNVVVIPACNESPGLLRPPPPCDGRSLMILVINESVSASREVSENNQTLATAVSKRFDLQWQHSPESGAGFELGLFSDPQAERDILLVDRFTAGRQLPLKGGVGHARKVGVDLAAGLIHRQRVLSPWIHCTDADVQMPETYFSCSKLVQDAGARYAALIYPFHHCDDVEKAESKQVVLATQLYELSLRYYVAAMKFAGSPYAFHTIGSTMAVSASHYAKVRGFPKREAGEDFYLLNKLAKVGSMLELTVGSECEAIEIAARRSDRVPFGTGAAVNKISAMADPVTEFRFYDPGVFELLQLWLQSLPAIWHTQSNELTESIFPDQPDGPDQSRKQRLLLAGLKTIKVEQALDHAFRQSKDLDQFTRQIHTWFDAFRTLKLIHALRDKALPSISYAELLTSKTYCLLLKQDSELSAFHKRLQQKILSGH